MHDATGPLIYTREGLTEPSHTVIMVEVSVSLARRNDPERLLQPLST